MASWEEFSRIVAEAKSVKKLDPVGHEDDDVDNDGDSDSSDTYLKKRRATVGAAIAADKKRKVEEAKQLDPVGKEDKDIDNDGDHDKSDKYLLNRRKVRSKIIDPQERLKTDRDMFNIPKSEQEAARERILAKTKAKRMKEEVEQIDEIAPLVAAGLAAGGAALAGAAINRAKKAADSGVDAANKGLKVKNPGTGIAGAAYGMQKRNNALNDAMKQLRQSYEFEGEIVDEDKEYRREMSKAAARERAEERREKGGKAAKSPGREGPSAGKTYADYQEISIKAHDKLTKKNKNVVGLVTKEENEIEEGMSMKDFKANRQKNKRRAASADAEKRGHVGKEWYNSGRKYSPDEAKRSRANMDDEERRTRHRSAVDPDNEDDNNYSADKTKNPKKLRKQKAMGEGYLAEKSLSRAQQRFMGMVYAAKKGETPASPEVAKAASGMSKKAARDFAKTKHEGLPEKKEEFSLVDRLVMEFSPLSEGKLDDLLADIRSEDDGNKKKPQSKKSEPVKKPQAKKSEPVKKPQAKKSESERKEQSKEEVKTRNTATERAARTSAASRIRAARIARETEKEKEAARTERQRERMSYAEKNKESKAKQKELESKKKEESSAVKAKQKEDDKKRKEQASAAKESAKAKQKESKDRQSELEKKEREKKNQLKTKEDSRKQRRSELARDVKSAWSGSTKVAGDKKDTEAVAAGMSNVGSLVSGVAKTGLALGKYAYKKAKEKRAEKTSETPSSNQPEKKEPTKPEAPQSTSSATQKAPTTTKPDTTPKKLTGTPERKKLVPSTKRLPPAGQTTTNASPKRETGMTLGQRARRNPALKSALMKNRMEEYSNWREEFIFEVDDQTVQNQKQKVIDVSKKKNKIEINPTMSEGCGCDEKENEKETPKKDMRDLPTKVNLLKTKLRSAGVRNPIVMVGVKEDWQSVNRKDKTDGLSQKAVNAYRSENPGSKLQTAVTEKKPTGKRADRRQSFCRRMSGMKKKLTSAETARDPDSNINKALRRWNCN